MARYILIINALLKTSQHFIYLTLTNIADFNYANYIIEIFKKVQ